MNSYLISKQCLIGQKNPRFLPIQKYSRCPIYFSSRMKDKKYLNEISLMKCNPLMLGMSFFSR